MKRLILQGNRLLRAWLWGAAMSTLTVIAAAQSPTASTFVGSEACRGCHEAEFNSHVGFAKKANSFASIERMRHTLTAAEFQGCFQCHTTGYGRPGGFRSEQETPELKNAGCEVCHGPGGRHVASAEASDIKGRLTRADCEGCHNEARVEAFGFKPIIYGGGH